MADWPDQYHAYAPPVLTSYSRESPISTFALTLAATRAWPSANLAIFAMMRVASIWTVNSMFTYNGGVASGNIDVGIYDSEGNRLTSNGGTLMSGTATLQNFTLTSTPTLRPGQYWWAMAVDNTTATFTSYNAFATGSLGGRFAGGLYQMATAYPLPATATFAAQTGGSITPFIGATSRSFL